jgi:hypothetical protein
LVIQAVKKIGDFGRRGGPNLFLANAALLSNDEVRSDQYACMYILLDLILWAFPKGFDGFDETFFAYSHRGLPTAAAHYRYPTRWHLRFCQGTADEAGGERRQNQTDDERDAPKASGRLLTVGQ